MKLDEINLNLLRTFYYVAQEGNLTKAAEKHFTSQPSLSRAIKQLEDEYKTQLFYRTLTGVELTEKGAILFDSINKSFELLNQSEVKIREADDFMQGRLFIGVPSQIGSLQLFEEISKFHKMYPNIEIKIVSKSTSQLLQLLSRHEIDFMIDTSPIIISSKNLNISHLCNYQNCFFIGNKFASNEIKQIKSLKEIEEYPVILPIPNTANREALDLFLKQNNIKLNNILNIHTSEMIISAVKKGAGIGYAIKNLIDQDIRSGEISILDIKEPLPMTEVCLVYDCTNLSKISQYFLKNFIKICI